MSTATIIGNATLDGIIGCPACVGDYMLTFMTHSGPVAVEVPSRDDGRGGPVAAGGKYTVATLLYDLTVPWTPRFGGGGYNSATVLAGLIGGHADVVRSAPDAPRDAPIELLRYLDLSTPALDTGRPGVSAAQDLAALGIEPYFLSCRPMPFNLVVGGRADKVILRSEITQPTISPLHHDWIGTVLDASDAVLVNSAKDPFLLERAMQSGKTQLAVVTQSLPRDYVLSTVIDRTACQLNQDEIGYVARDANPLSAIGQFSSLQKQLGLYVTLGSAGTLVAQGDHVYQVQLTDAAKAQVGNAIAARDSASCGAGDAHAAGVFYAQLAGKGPIDCAIQGTLAAVAYLGFTAEHKDVLMEVIA
ncbi:hypothetical protein AUJ68_07070 [Candidatus Woesearchaeota archaeon CG1_02_57_44]|nr:MAG: hypothetical protein AUJ68_07070 [Candidatus Woesearchaeota archaeon CG1_02_57_44]